MPPSPVRRNQLAFRGLRDASWKLLTTLDQVRIFATDFDRLEYSLELRREFYREAIRIVANPSEVPDPGTPAFELLARHHGVPSMLLDWSESPYIASFFAFEGAGVAPQSSIAIWVFDTAMFVPRPGDVELIVDQILLRENRRALRQRGLFTRISTVIEPLEELLAGALTKLVIPASSKALALADLDEMGMNAATLFADLDGAARTAGARMNP